MTDVETGVLTTVVAGKNVTVGAPPPPCEHRTFNAMPVGAVFVDDDHAVTGRALKVKVRCAECGAPMRLLAGSARVSEIDGDLAIVVDMEPTEGG